MRLRRTYPIFAGVLLVAISLAALIFLRKHAPPEPARLLPGADGFVYLDFSWLRRAGVGKALPPITHDPDYQQFVDATGFQFETDLDEFALAIHYAPAGTPPAPEGGTNLRYSEVLTGT
ncbi:MAG: hypothetical protein H0X25_17670, partial [Acidobacteriales bacterium]|nr:hypothetical protein [Terriglobales bacterium]